MSSSNTKLPEATETHSSRVDKTKPDSDEPSTSTGIKTQYAISISVNPEGTQPIVKTQILDETNFDEPSTSTGIKAQYSINLSVNLGESKLTFAENDSLSSLDELALRLLKEKGNVEDHESFITADGCRQEIATTTEPIMVFSRNEQMQNASSRGPPPYYQSPPPPYDSYNSSYPNDIGQTPIYQGRHAVPPQVMMETTSREQLYRRHSHRAYFLNIFDSTYVRNKFLQKVYLFLSTQLLLVFGIILFCVQEKNTRKFIQQDHTWYIVSLIVFFVSYMMLVCCLPTRQLFPLNFLLLFSMTLSMAHLAAVISCVYDTYIVMASFGVTAGICLFLSLLACQYMVEATECVIALCLFSFIIIVYLVIALFITALYHYNVDYLIYSCVLTETFCMYLMYDLQQILDGARVELTPDEYIYGAIQSYVDILICYVMCMGTVIISSAS